MKILTLKINETTYTTGRITAYHTRKCFELNKSTIELGQLGKTVTEDNFEKAAEVFEKVNQLNLEKMNFICEIYENKFTVDILERSLTTDEINKQIADITESITGVITKN